MKKYAIIHFIGKKSIKRYYDTAMKAFYDHKEKGCVKVELFNSSGIMLSSYTKPNIK